MKSSRDQMSMELVAHRTYDANPNTTIMVDLGNDTAWVTQKQMAELFDLSVKTISEHVVNIKRERGERAESVIRNFRITASDGKTYEVEHYDMTVVNLIGARAHHTETVAAFQDWVGRQLNHTVVQNYTEQETETDSDAVFLEVRSNGTVSRKALMATIKRVVINANPSFYGAVTNDVYRGVFGRDTQQLKRDLQTETPRDKMSIPALAYLSIAEFLGSQHLTASDELTIPQARQIIQGVASVVGMQVSDIEQKLGVDMVTGRRLLGPIDAVRGT